MEIANRRTFVGAAPVAALLEQGGMRVERREIRLDLGGRPRVVVASR